MLNGASSAGKTTLATGFRDQRAVVGDFWLLTGIDDYLARLPAQWQSIGSYQGALAEQGVRFETSRDGLVVSVGHLGRRLLLLPTRPP